MRGIYGNMDLGLTSKLSPFLSFSLSTFFFLFNLRSVCKRVNRFFLFFLGWVGLGAVLTKGTGKFGLGRPIRARLGFGEYDY